jgi:amino acid permease
MIGTGIFVYPLLYRKIGIITCQVIVLIVGFISYKTA